MWFKWNTTIKCLAYYLANSMHAKMWPSTIITAAIVQSQFPALTLYSSPVITLFSSQTGLFPLLNIHLYNHTFTQPAKTCLISKCYDPNHSWQLHSKTTSSRYHSMISQVHHTLHKIHMTLKPWLDSSSCPTESQPNVHGRGQ